MGGGRAPVRSIEGRFAIRSIVASTQAFLTARPDDESIRATQLMETARIVPPSCALNQGGSPTPCTLPSTLLARTVPTIDGTKGMLDATTYEGWTAFP